MVMTAVFGEFGMPGTFYTHTHSCMHLMRCRVQMQKETQQGHKCTGIRKLHQRAHGNGNRWRNQVGEWPSAIDFMPSLFSLRVCALWVHKVNGLKKHISLSGNFNKYVQFIRSHAPIERSSNQECFPTSQLKQRIPTKKSYEFNCVSTWWKSLTWIQWLTT